MLVNYFIIRYLHLVLNTVIITYSAHFRLGLASRLLSSWKQKELLHRYCLEHLQQCSCRPLMTVTYMNVDRGKLGMLLYINYITIMLCWTVIR